MVLQLFGAEGPFAVQPGASPSVVQKEMERLGLPIAALKVAGPEILGQDGGQIVSQKDMVCCRMASSFSYV